MNYEQYFKLIEGRLSVWRYTHSVNVAAMCKELCEHHGIDAVTSDKIYVAGIFHDIMKEHPDFELRAITLKSDFAPAPEEIATRKLWHAIAGATYVRDILKISDPEILNAIRFHTVCRANMSIVERIVCLADRISIDRTLCEDVREIAFENYDEALYLAIKRGIKKTLKKDGKIPHYTIDAYHYFNQLLEK
jgi:nicotinate-nucleotide adenylyltransferase